ncbi:MAG: hypothetical protein NVSMB19_25590 [Vulcanimicrobiaceae bacterium]
MNIATTLFAIVMGVTFVIAIVRYATLNHTLEGFPHAFMDLFIKVVPPFVIVAAATTVLPNIAPFANTLSGEITGTPITGPSEIVNLGTGICHTVLTTALSAFTSGNLLGAIVIAPYLLCTALVLCGVIMGAFTLIAFEYFFAFAQAYVRLSIKAINLGWLAGSGTKHFAEEFISEAWAAVMRIVITVAVVGLIVSFVPQMETIAASGDVKAMITSWFALAASAIFAALLAWKVPELAHSGRPSVSAAHVANQTFRTATQAAKFAA